MTTKNIDIKPPAPTQASEARQQARKSGQGRYSVLDDAEEIVLPVRLLTEDTRPPIRLAKKK